MWIVFCGLDFVSGDLPGDFSNDWVGWFVASDQIRPLSAAGFSSCLLYGTNDSSVGPVSGPAT